MRMLRHTSLRKLWKYQALVLLLGLTACGKQTFDKQQFSAKVTANQYVTIKPKVDIILFQDVSASMLTPLNSLKSQLNSFLQSINANWDFHFAVLPLQRQDDLRNRYIVAQNCSTITTGYCLSPSQASAFDSTGGWYPANASDGSTDLGFDNMRTNLSNSGSMAGSGFLRSDAMLVVIPFTNGNDISGMSYPQDYMDRGDGQLVPNYNSPGAISSFNSFYNYLANLVKSSVSQMNFYSVAAALDYSSCYGAPAWAGTRYNNMALAIDNAYPNVINGARYDLCAAGQLNTVMANIAARMKDVIIAIEFNFVVLADRPVPQTLHIFKNNVEIPANTSNNGWTLYNVVGGTQQYTANKATSYAPSPGNNQSGYFIELHGSARFKGSDSITISYEKQ